MPSRLEAAAALKIAACRASPTGQSTSQLSDRPDDAAANRVLGGMQLRAQGKQRVPFDMGGKMQAIQKAFTPWCGALALFALIGCGATPEPSSDASVTSTDNPLNSTPTFATLGKNAISTLEKTFYAGNGKWHMCTIFSECGTKNTDWGADTMTETLWFHWKLDRNTIGANEVPQMMKDLADTARTYNSSLNNWSDAPLWDAIADLREYEASGGYSVALTKAKAAFDYVDKTSKFTGGTCPDIPYQHPNGGSQLDKTLETSSAYIKAALLLYKAKNDSSYLTKAETLYQAARNRFLDSDLPLYTNYVFDDGVHPCTQAKGQFFASVNGNMIDNGLYLYKYTGTTSYLNDAKATAEAVINNLADPSGIFENLQADNDVGEPLVEAMYYMGRDSDPTIALPDAITWLEQNADWAAGDVTSSNNYGRFFGGPPPKSGVLNDVFQESAGLAIQIAAARIEPTASPQKPTNFWSNPTSVTQDITVTSSPGSFSFTGQAVAIYGTLGEQCCEPGHARVFIDGQETTSEVGIWQNKSSTGTTDSNYVLFAWRWPIASHHTIEIEPGIANAKEGGSFFHMRSYSFVP
jgi:hypothetical protein